MIEKLDDYLVGITLGIRFRANFSIEDQLGRITDTILYSKDSFFNPNVFPLVRSGGNKQTLLNNSTQDYLLIDNSNIIIDLNLSNDLKFSANNLPLIFENFNKQIIKGIFRDFSIQEIRRIGYIRNYIIPVKEFADTFVNRTIGGNIDGVNDINLSFSKKIPIMGSLVKKGVSDYDNAIFNIIKLSNKDEIFISLDYQSFFDPFLPDSSVMEFSPFLEKALYFNNNALINWLNRNYMEAKDEH